MRAQLLAERSLNPLKNGAVFRHADLSKAKLQEGLNPLKNGAVFRLGIPGWAHLFLGLNPLKNGAVFRPRQPRKSLMPPWVSIP